MANWKVQVTFKNGEVVKFTAMAPHSPTKEQKALWETRTGEKAITRERIRAVTEADTKEVYVGYYTENGSLCRHRW